MRSRSSRFWLSFHFADQLGNLDLDADNGCQHLIDIVLRGTGLRERPEDIPLLVEHFMGMLAPYLDVPRLKLDGRTLARMAAYDWPGNVRELKNFVERSLILGW